MRIGALLLALAAVLVVAEAHSSKFLPAVRASLKLGSSLLRHVAAVKDRLREDVERHLLRQVEHRPGHEFVFELPSWKKPVLPRPWTSPAFHTSFSYQASSLPMLPLPFFPRPLPAIVVVPCRKIKTHIAHFVMPCIRIVGELPRPTSGLGASQPNNVTQGTSNVTVDDTTSDLAPRAPTSTMTYGTDPEEQYVTGVATRAVDVTENSSTTTYETTTETEEVTPTPSELASDVTVTDAASFALGTRVEDGTTVTDSPDIDVTTEAGYDKHSAEGPFTLDRKSNMIFDERPTTTTDGNARDTTEQPTSSATDDTNFNDILKEAEAAFAKLHEQ